MQAREAFEFQEHTPPYVAEHIQPYAVDSLAGTFGLVLLLPGAPRALASASAAMCTQSCATSNRILGQGGQEMAA